MLLQEADNVNFVLDNEVGTFEKDPKKIASILQDWFGERSEELAAMSERARAMGHPDALFRIVEDLAALAQEHEASVLAEERRLQTLLAA